MKVPAFQGSKGATRRAERVAKTLSMPPEPVPNVSVAIDEQIASLLQSVSSKHEAQAAVMDPDVRPDARPRRRARSTRTRTFRRPHRPTQTVRYALSDITVQLPRPYLSYTVRQAFSLLAIVLLSIAVGLLLVYLAPA
jgi:hypothetical protein